MADGFGIDLAQANGDFLPGLPERDGLELVMQDLVGWFDTDENHLAQHLPEGYPWDETAEGRGYNLRNLVNAKIRDVSVIEARVESECRKDERVSDASATVTMTSDGAMSIVVRVQADEGDFSFTIEVTELTIESFFNGREV